MSILKQNLNNLKIKQVARKWLNEEGLTDWSFKFDNAKRRAGLCSWDKKTISLSLHFVLMNKKDEVELTLLHEMAHALAPHREHHGRVWRLTFKNLLIKYKWGERWNRELKVERCYGNEVNMPLGKYLLSCINCNKSWARHKKVWWFSHKDENNILEKAFCPSCGKKEGKLKIQLRS